MTQFSYEQHLNKIMAQEEKYGVEIKIDSIIDKDHLDCLWYGGEVGFIKYRGYKIVIGAYGDVRLFGKINGSGVEVKDKNNAAEAYGALAVEHGLTDDDLRSLFESTDPENYLIYENNNWFEVDLISPDGEWIDLCGSDNVLSDDILECFIDVESYFEYVDEEIEDSQAEFCSFLEAKGELIDCSAFDLLCLLASKDEDVGPNDDPPISWDIQLIGDLVDYAERLLRTKGKPVCRPFFEGKDETPCCFGKDCQRADCLFRKRGN